MIKHVILWTLKEEYNEQQKEQIKKEIKSSIEALNGKIEGLVDIIVYIDKLPSSNADLMLDSTFIDEQSLKDYAIHPEHVEVANAKVRPYTSSRSCLDFKI